MFNPQLEFGKIIVALLIFLVISVLLFFQGFKLLKKARLIENLPTSKIRSIALGLVEVCGKPMPLAEGAMLTAPFSRQSCLYCRYTVEERRSSGKSRRWVKISGGEVGQRIYLQDETGRVQISLTGAELSMPISYAYSTTSGRPVPEGVKSFCDQIQMPIKNFVGLNRSLRFTEYSITSVKSLYVLGTAGPDPFKEDGLSDEHTESIVIYKYGKNPLLIADTPEKKIVSRIRLNAIFCTVLGGILLIVFLSAIISFTFFIESGAV